MAKQQKIVRDRASSSNRLLLLALFVLIPGIVLVVLSVRIVAQERELVASRALETQANAIRELSQQLLVTAERYKIAAERNRQSRQDVAIPVDVLVATAEIRDQDLVLDQERINGTVLFQESISVPSFAAVIRDAERAEYGSRGLSEAIRLNLRALEMAEDSIQAAYAELLLSRVLAKSGRGEDAIDAQLRLIEYPVTIIDEYSIPLPLYAAERLTQSSQYAQPIVQYLTRQASDPTLLTGPAIIMLRSLIDDLRSKPLPDSISVQFNDLAVELERAMETRAKLIELSEVYADGIAPIFRSLSPQRRGESWITYGSEPWLLSVSDTAVPLLVILDASTIMKEVFFDVSLGERGFSRVQLMSTASDSSHALGSSFPNGHVTLTAATAADTIDPAITRSIIFLLVTLGAVALASFGAYMWYRGLQREVQTARMRSSFVSSVSHELKTPLTSIRMFSEILRFKPPEESVREEYLDTILNESQRLTRLLNNVLNFSKIEEGTLTYRLEPVCLTDILSSSLRTMDYPVHSDGFTLQTDIPEEELTVMGDRDALEQAVLNLISNAMKYSIGMKEIVIRLYKNEHHACIEVEDHGLGIQPDEIQKIFQSFYRSRDAHGRHIPGTGLGLSIVAHTMQAHHGGVTVDSVPGEGSTFTLYLPIVSA